MSRAVLDTPVADAAQPGGIPELEVLDPQGGVARVELTGEHLLIGRAPDSGLRLEGGTVSRQHAEIFRDPFGRWWVRDLGSRNGVKVGGERVAERVLQPGNTFQLGQYRLTFRVPRPAGPALVDTGATTGVLRFDDGAADRFSTLDEGDHPRIAAGHLSSLMKFGRELLDADLPATRLDLLCRLMVSADFKGRCALVFRVSRSDADAPPAMLSGPVSCESPPGGVGGDDVAAPPPYLSRSLVRHLRETAQPVLASNLPGTREAIEVSMAPDAGTVSAVACPLVDPSSDALDVLYVTLPPQYGTVEWLAIASLAAEQYRLADNAWLARRHAESHAITEQELRRARQIQLRLVPKHLAVPGLDIAVGYEPCRWVGGDYVDVAPGDDGRLLLAVADVCGKGMPAALIATSLRTMVRTGLRAAMDLPDILAAMRPQIGDVCEDSFVTMAAVQIDPRSGTMRCVNAGHPASFIISPDGATRDLPCAENFPLGIMFEPIECRDEVLRPGEMLVMFTDGVSELADPAGAMLGCARFATEVAAIYREHHAQPATQLAARVAAALDEFRAGRSADDDQTFLLARRV